jgi:hypothetical protein
MRDGPDGFLVVQDVELAILEAECSDRLSWDERHDRLKLPWF